MMPYNKLWERQVTAQTGDSDSIEHELNWPRPMKPKIAKIAPASNAEQSVLFEIYLSMQY